MKDAITKNRQRQAQLVKYRRVLNRLRLRWFDYEDSGQLPKARKIAAKITAILMPKQK